MTANTPFEYAIRVGWGDCDPAKIAYTGNIPGWALEAIDAWWEAHLGDCGWFHMELDRNMGTPFVHMTMDFRTPITPRHRLVCSVEPVRLGTSSIRFRVIGRQDGQVCFEGTFVCVFTVADQFKPQPAPAEIRAIVEPLIEAE